MVSIGQFDRDSYISTVLTLETNPKNKLLKNVFISFLFHGCHSNKYVKKSIFEL